MDAKVFHHGDPVIKAGGGRGTVIAAFRDRSSGALRGRRRPWGSTDTAIGTTGATERVSPTGFNVVGLASHAQQEPIEACNGQIHPLCRRTERRCAARQNLGEKEKSQCRSWPTNSKFTLN
jgi:hypothetical protein